MKKNLLSLLIMVGFCSYTMAQIVIFEDFDSYQPGDLIHEVNPQYFPLWPNTTIGHEISDAQSASPNNSVYLFSDSGGGPADVIMDLSLIHI